MNQGVSMPHTMGLAPPLRLTSAAPRGQGGPASWLVGLGLLLSGYLPGEAPHGGDRLATVHAAHVTALRRPLKCEDGATPIITRRTGGARRASSVSLGLCGRARAPNANMREVRAPAS
jgi:hypothetical protein